MGCYDSFSTRWENAQKLKGDPKYAEELESMARDLSSRLKDKKEKLEVLLDLLKSGDFTPRQQAGILEGISNLEKDIADLEIIKEQYGKELMPYLKPDSTGNKDLNLSD